MTSSEDPLLDGTRSNSCIENLRNSERVFYEGVGMLRRDGQPWLVHEHDADAGALEPNGEIKPGWEKDIPSYDSRMRVAKSVMFLNALGGAMLCSTIVLGYYSHSAIYFAILVLWAATGTRLQDILATQTLLPLYEYIYDFQHVLQEARVTSDSFVPWLSRLSFTRWSSIPSTTAPLATGYVIGNAFKLYYDLTLELDRRWSRGWAGFPLVGTLLMYLGFPLCLVLATFVPWILCCRELTSKIRRARKAHLDDTAFATICAAVESTYMSFLANVMHFHRIERSSDCVAEMLGVKWVFTTNLKIYGGQEMKNALTSVATYARTEVFAFKTFPTVIQLLLKSSWLMISFNIGSGEVASNIIACTLSLLSVMLDCSDHFQLVLALRAFKIMLDPDSLRARMIKGRCPERVAQQLADADLNHKVQKIMVVQSVLLAVNVTLTALALSRIAGALVCPSHLFGITTGCT